MCRLKRKDRALLQAKKGKKNIWEKMGKKKQKSNQSQSDRSRAKGGIDIDESGW
jgi:hypothetical protein